MPMPPQITPAQFPGQSPGPLGQPLDLPDEWNPLPRPARDFDYRPLPFNDRPGYPMPTDTDTTDTSTDTSAQASSAVLIIGGLSVVLPVAYVVYNWKMLAKGSAWTVLALAMVVPPVMFYVLAMAAGAAMKKA